MSPCCQNILCILQTVTSKGLLWIREHLFTNLRGKPLCTVTICLPVSLLVQVQLHLGPGAIGPGKVDQGLKIKVNHQSLPLISPPSFLIPPHSAPFNLHSSPSLPRSTPFPPTSHSYAALAALGCRPCSAPSNGLSHFTAAIIPAVSGPHRIGLPNDCLGGNDWLTRPWRLVHSPLPPQCSIASFSTGSVNWIMVNILIICGLHRNEGFGGHSLVYTCSMMGIVQRGMNDCQKWSHLFYCFSILLLHSHLVSLMSSLRHGCLYWISVLFQGIRIVFLSRGGNEKKTVSYLSLKYCLPLCFLCWALYCHDGFNFSYSLNFDWIRSFMSNRHVNSQ